jgi:phage/plasmid-associated DNA primase
MSKQAIDFISRLFGTTSESPVYVCSLANEKNDPTEPDERHIATRQPDDVLSFLSKWDRAKRGMFVCVSTIRNGSRRSKDGVAEICFLHADIDFKDVIDDPDTILRRLKSLPKPPALIVASGNGYHCYWPLKEALTVNIIDGAETIERVESDLKLLADLVGGDMKVTQVAALMRLPGTHNSKRDEWKLVETIHQSDSRYELDDLEEMLAETSPIVLRKLRPSPGAGEINPYLAFAESLGFKPPLDVEKRLAAMTYMGGGDAAIHATQIAVTASLLNAGVPIEEVVKTVLEATRLAAGDYGARWNWKREERAIHNACDTWLKKHPVVEKLATKPSSAPTVTNTSGGGATVHNLSEARAKNKEKEAKPKTQKMIDRENMHVVVGSTILKMLQDKGTPILVVVDQLWRYQNGIWASPENKGRHALDAEIETCIRAMDFPSSLKLVAESRGWFFRNPDIYRENMEWDDHGKIAIRGGLIDSKTLAFEPASPSHHVTARIDCDYDSAALCPKWLEMLEAMFVDRPDVERTNTIRLIQEILGCALIVEKSKALSRALIFHGVSNTGKTDLIKTLSGLLTDHPISTPLGSLDGTHGLMEFMRNAPWILHEAFDSQKWHFSAIVKSILSGDPVQINVKNSVVTTRRIRQPVIWGTNVPPQFKEATRAIINRMIVISCYTVFDPENPVGVALDAQRQGFSEPSEMILAQEKPGLLNWALAGLQRALERGYFATTLEMKETLETVRTDSNIVAGFLEECASFSPDYMISTSDFCAAFSVWWAESKGEDRHTPSNESIGRALVAFGDPRVGIDRKVLRDNRHGYYAGLWLNDIGLDYWAGASAEGLARGKTARTSSNQADVNRSVPPTWEGLPVIQKIRNASVRDLGASSETENGEQATSTKIRDRSPRF